MVMIRFLPPVIQLRRQERGQQWLWLVGEKSWIGVGQRGFKMPW